MRYWIACLLCLFTVPVFAQANGARNTMLLYKGNTLRNLQSTNWWKTVGDNNGAATAASQKQSANNFQRAGLLLGQADTEEANAGALIQQATSVEQSADLLNGNGQFYPATAMYGKARDLWVQAERATGLCNACHEGARFFYERIGP